MDANIREQTLWRLFLKKRDLEKFRQFLKDAANFFNEDLRRSFSKIFFTEGAKKVLFVNYFLSICLYNEIMMSRGGGALCQTYGK